MRVNMLFFLLLVELLFWPSRAAAGGGLLDVPRLRAEAAAWLMQQATTAFPGSVAEAEIGEVDPRLRLPACAESRFFLPANAPLWGRGSLGARCEAPTRWLLYLAYQSRLRGPGLVATRPLAAREQPAGGDIELRQIEYAQSPDLYPRVLPPDVRVNRPLAAGQPILISWLSLPAVIQAGRKVRLQARTAAFTVSQEGTALNAAAPGEMVRVKTPGGRIVQGTARQDGSVDVRP